MGRGAPAWVSYLVPIRAWHWLNRRGCRRGRHDITGPWPCADGRARWVCSRCSHRFLASEVV